jgi:glycosyltransferase involved in cell wall biosynthesis
MTDKRGISVVIPAYNEEKYLPKTLSSIKEACRFFEVEAGEPTEIIVVDNSSTDRTAEVAKVYGTRVICHEVRNIASVRNAGIKAAKYDLVVTVDADNYVPPDAFTKISKVMHTGRYVGGGVKIKVESNSWHLKLAGFLIDQLILRIAGISAGMFFFWKTAADTVGGFPEESLIAEDIAFAKRLKRFGQGLGQKFCNLRSVHILTLDRKPLSFVGTVGVLWQTLKYLIGRTAGIDELGYWYNPKR